MKKILLFALSLSFLALGCKKNYTIDAPTIENSTVINFIPFENTDLKIDFSCSLPYSPKQFYFSDEANGICLTNDGELYTTKDKSKTWEKSYGSIADSIFVKDVKLIDDLTYIACGNIKNLGVVNGFISKTTDGGKTWQMVQKIPNFDIMKLTVNENKQIYALSFSNDSSKLTTNVLKSLNSGQSWDVISTLDEFGYNIYPISNSRLAIQSNKSILLISNDQGKTWANDAISKSFPFVTNFKFGQGYGFSGNENTGNYDIFKTTDNGDTWGKAYSSKLFISKSRLNIVSPTTIFAFGTNNYYGESQQKYFISQHIIYTLNAAKSWKELDFQTCNMGYTISSFYDEKHGYMFDGTLYKITIK